MPYLNIDDGMDEHEKVEALSDAAYRLLMASLHYCARNLTDGFVPLSKARRLTATGDDVVAKELLDAGVWHDLGEGCDDRQCVKERTCHGTGRKGSYLVHDYLQWNHSKAWWEKRKDDQRERTRKWRAEQAKNKNQQVSPGNGNASRNALRAYPGDESRAAPDTEQNRYRDQRPDTNPLGLTPAVDGSSSVTEIQTARAKRAKGDGFEGETA